MEKMKILIVDDETSILKSMNIILENKYHVMLAPGGQEAFDLVIKESGMFDLIICDLSMPIINGPSLYLMITDKYKHLENNFIFMTGGIFGGYLDDFGINTKNPFLEKPFEHEELNAVVEKFFLKNAK